MDRVGSGYVELWTRNAPRHGEVNLSKRLLDPSHFFAVSSGDLAASDNFFNGSDTFPVAPGAVVDL